MAWSGRLCETRSDHLPVVLALQDGMAIIVEEDLFPTVSLVEIEIQREGATAR